MTTCDKLEDPTPTTLEWLVACGLENRKGYDYATFYFVVNNENRVLHIWPDGDAFFGVGGKDCQLPGRYETRGKVRRLFAGLQIPVNEPEEIVSLGPLWAVKRLDGLLIGQQCGVPQDSFVAYPNRKQAAERASGSSGTIIRIA